VSEIRLEQVGKVYDGDVRAVDGVTLTIESGEFMVAEVAEEARVRPGDGVELALDPTRLHFFDPESGASLRAAAVASAA
jgi:hypothetical protein